MADTAENMQVSLAEQYQDLWDSSPSEPQLESFLSNRDPVAVDELAEILWIDQAQRWSRGAGRPVEEYLAAFPEVASQRDLKIDLVYGEYRARRTAGLNCPIESFCDRFPDLREELMRQLEFLSWLLVDAKVAEATDLQQPQKFQTFIIDSDATEPADESDDANEEDIAPLPFDDFELIELLGAGAMGEVHLARQKSLNKKVAIKILGRKHAADWSRVERFVREARAVAALRHPNIVGVHGIGRCPQGYFLVMDLVDGESLDRTISEHPLPVERVVEICMYVADAIDHAHKRKVIHRDIKPSNILIDSDNRVLVADFGLAKTFFTDRPVVSVEGQIVGTPNFMAPEQADPSRGDVTPATDVYGIGALLYMLLCGRPPVEGRSCVEVIGKVISAEPPKRPRDHMPAIPAAIDSLCMKCLEKEPSKRFATAAELRDALKNCLSNKPEPHTPPPDSWWQRNARYCKALAALAATACIVYGLSLIQGPGTTGGTPSPMPVAGPVDVKWHFDVFRAGDSARHLRITEVPGSIHTGDKIRIAAQLSREMYVYPYWIDSEGAIAPLGESPTGTSTVSVNIPGDAASGLPVEGTTGTELCVLVLRDKPLTAADEALLAKLPPTKKFPKFQYATVVVDDHAVPPPDDKVALLDKLNAQSRAVGKAQPLGGREAEAALAAWRKSMPADLGEVHYIAVSHDQP